MNPHDTHPKVTGIAIYIVMPVKEEYYHNSAFDLYLDASNIPRAGLGVFTKEYIPPNTRIDEYVGDICSSYNPGLYVLEIARGRRIDAQDFPRCYMGMLNDCSHVTTRIIHKKKKKIDVTPDAYYDKNNMKLDVNCEFVMDLINTKAFIHSVTGINPGSELFVSYGDDYWN